MQVNIVDVVGREVNLKKAGANYKGLCPFHSEKTPSFMVNEEKQIFNCFGCGQKGDVIKFVQTYYKLPFVEAVEKLCNEYGIRMPERRSSRPKIDYDKYYEINAKAARFFYNSLGVRGNKGLAYLKGRGLSKETITKFGLGYAPDSYNALTDYLRSEGVSDEDMLKLGLANKGKNGLYDKFRNRVIFPIIDTRDKVIGFGGRALGDIKPKYLNSSESEIFLKKNNLFGLNFTRKEISDEDRVIIVEGYMDAISLYQGGVKNVAASLGTALTDNQAKLVCRYTKNVVLSYDSDNAGINAALRGIDVMNKAGAKVRILTVTDGKDPDEFIKKHGREAFLKLVDNALPATDFRLNIAKSGCDLGSDLGVLEYIEKIVPVLKSLGPLEQDIYIRRLSQEYNISEHAIGMAVRTEGNERHSVQSTRRTSDRKAGSGGADIKIEMALLILAMNNTSYLKRIREDGIVMHSELSAKVLSAEESVAEKAGNGLRRIEAKEIFNALSPDDENAFSGYVNSVQIGPDDEEFYRETRAAYLISGYRQKRAEILNELAVAEKMYRPDEMSRLASELIDIDRLINETTEGNNG